MVSIQHRNNTQKFATKIFQVKNELSSEIICDYYLRLFEIIFIQRTNNHYNLRNVNHFETSFARAVSNGTESVSYLGPKIWNILPEEYKTLNCLNSFQEQKKVGYPLIVPADFAKPMCIVLVF